MARYACSDLHGRYDLAEKILAALKPSDELYFLGDAIDRGHRSWDTLQLLLNDPRVTFMCGNHEDFLVKLYDGNPKETIYIDRYAYHRWEVREVWDYNGGWEMMEKCDDLRERSPETLHTLIETIKNARDQIIFTNDKGKQIVLTHAGYTPGRRKSTKDSQIWDRQHLKNSWPKDEAFKDTIMIHGHTPIQYIDSTRISEDGPIYYADGHKIDIDLGAVFYGWTTLLDLDTLDNITIEGDHKYDI